MVQQIFDTASYGYSAFALPIGTVAVLALCVGAWVVWHERGRQVSISFFVACLAIAIYMGGFAFMVQAATYPVALFWGKFAYVGIPFIIPSVYQFSMDLLGLRRQRATLVRIAWLVGLVYMVLAVATDLLVAGVFRMSWGYITRITWFTYPIFLWSVFIVGAALFDYFREYRSAGAVQKARIRLFAIPILIGTLALIDYAPSLGYPVAPWGFVVFALFLFSASWAVARYHLPDLTPSFAADQIVATMAEPLLVCDARGTIAFANPATARLLGRSQDELVQRPIAEIFGADTAQLLQSVGPTAPREVEIRGRDGALIQVAVSTSRIEAKGGQQVGTVVVARDIRDRKAAEREIERREERFRALIEQARDTITIVDETGRIIYESPAVRVYGYDAADTVGTSILDRVHPEDVDTVKTVLESLLDRPGSLIEGEARVLDAEGSVRNLEFRATNLLEHRAVRGVVINARDVTEERRLDAQLQQAQKMEAVGRLAGGVAHDFNNILTAIQGNVVLLREQLRGDPETLTELEEIAQGTERAARLTGQLLAFSRRQVVRPRVVDLNRVVEGMRRMLRRLIGETIVLVTRPDAEAATIRADPGQLDQVVLNLVVNARDAVGSSGRIEVTTGTVEVDEEQARTADFQLEPGRYVLLTVRDDGPGMDESTLSRLFEPFYTTKPAGRGTGLGLSTVYGAVRQAGGFVGVESEPGEGTTFCVYYPLVADAEPPAEARPDRPSPAEPSGDAVILVVEDEAPVRSLMVRVLERKGYHVLEAQDGDVALEVAASHDGPIDLLIADLVMPGLNGREVAERLLETRPGLATIFISGYTADEVLRHGISTGQHRFLPKPFTPDEIVREVAGVLDRDGT
jgi:PAS domain S-box-containing protein